MKYETKPLEGIPWSEMLYYDETSPSCLRHKTDKIRPNNKSVARYAGDVAGNKNKYSNYWCYSSSEYGTFQCHRIIWYITYGHDIPNGKVVDHIDGNRGNNLLSNLRLIDYQDNTRNAKMYSSNTTGITGVYLDNKRDKFNVSRFYWKASWIEIDGKQKTKAFSIDKFGNDEALKLAIAFRSEQIARLNAEGAGCSDRHGK